MNTPSFQPDPSKKTSDYRANQVQDAAARTVRVERARMEKLWNQHLDGEMAADSKAEFETLCKRYPDLSRELRSTGMLLSGMNLLTADVPASPVADRERTAAILAAVQAERPFVSAGEARAIRRQRWILVGSAAALLISVVAADRFFPGWKDPAGMIVASRTAAPATAARESSLEVDVSQSHSPAAIAQSQVGSRAAVEVRRESLNANAKLSMGAVRHDGMNFSTDLVPTMGSQATASTGLNQPFGLNAQEAWLLRSVAASTQSIEPFIASAQLRLTDSLPQEQWTGQLVPSTSAVAGMYGGAWDGELSDRWNGLLHDRPLPLWYMTPKQPHSKSGSQPQTGSR